MKKAISFMVLAVGLVSGAFGDDQPGWFAYAGERIAHGENRWRSTETKGPHMRGLGAMAAEAAPDFVSPEIEELARNLHHDPKLIFQFVHNKIDYVPYFGFMKGARQTLLERAGNDADISALLVALLRASGYEAEYVYGTQQIPTVGGSPYTAARWFDVEDVASAVDRVLLKNGIPGIAEAQWTYLDRIWVECDIDGATRRLDAAFKPRERGIRFDFATAMNYDRSDLLNAAGGVVSSNNVKSLNEVAIKNLLGGWATTLVETLQSDHAGAEMHDLLGQSRIVDLEFSELPTSLLVPSYVIDRWETPPEELMHRVRIQHGAIDETLSFADIAGRRLAISYDAPGAMKMAGLPPAEKMQFDPDSEASGIAHFAPPQSIAPSNSFAGLSMELVPEPAEPIMLNMPLPSEEGSNAQPGNSAGISALSQPESAGGGYAPLAAPQFLGSFVQGKTNIWDIYGGQLICNNGNGNDTFYHDYYLTTNTENSFSISPSTFDLKNGQCTHVYLNFSAIDKTRGNKYLTFYKNWGYRKYGGWYSTPPESYYVFVAETLQGKIAPTDGEFGWGYLGNSETRTVAIKNNGSQPLQFTITGLGGNHPQRFELVGFSAPYGPVTISAGSTKSFTVRYKRDQAGAHYGTVRMGFVYDGFNYGTNDIINLWGSTHRQPNVTTNHIDFQARYYQNPAVATGGLHNAGSEALQITSVSLVGPDAGRFELVSGNSPGSVGSGQTRNVGVRYKADVIGHHWNAAVQMVYTYDGVSGYAAYAYLNGQTISAPHAQLWLDDDLVDEETGPISEPVSGLTLSFMHPTMTNSTYATTYSLKRGASYAVIADFGAAQGGDYLETRQRRLAEYRRAGLADDSREVLTETLHILGHTWMRQTSLADDLLDAVANTRRSYHHRFGLMAQEEGYYVDVKSQLFSPIARDGQEENASVAFRAGGLIASALEHGMLEQMQGTNNPAASTVKLLQLANSGGQKIFLADSNNYATVLGQLTNYSTNELASLLGRIQAGQTLVLPQNADIVLNQWKGAGYIVSGPGADGTHEIGMIIAGDYYGGYAGYPESLNINYVAGNNNWVFVHSVETPKEPVLDPLDIATGHLLYDKTDLTLGDGVPPRGVTLARVYHSGQHALRSPLGYGWRHNLDIRAHVRSEGAAGLGRRSPADAAALLVATVAIEDLVRHEPNAKGWLTASLVAKWAADQLTDNAVSVQIGDENMEFIRQPDGSYTPPPGQTAELEKDGATFVLKQRHGIELHFNAAGRLAAWTDADGNEMAFTYNARTNVQTVVDAYNRTLTFSYDGSGSNLVSVSDGTGRTVGYSVAGGNLNAVTDVEGKVWNYAYDAWHRMVTHADPLGQTLVSNVYSETSGRVLAQVNAVGQWWNMYVVPQFRSVEETPLGERTVYWFDDRSRRVARADAEGNEHFTGYDGQNRLIFEVDPLWNVTLYRYDARHNLTNRTDALGGETSFDYDGEDRLIAARDPLGHETRTEYNAQHHPIKITDALSNETQIVYTQDGLPETFTGPRGEVTAYSYDAYGNPQTITRTDGGVESRVHNARGDVLSVTDANTNTTAFTWDRRRLQISATDPLGGVVSNSYNGAGLLVSRTDARGGVTERGWTPLYELDHMRYPDGSVVSNVYDVANRLVAVIDPLGHARTNAYDGAGRLIAQTDPLGHTTHYLHDAAGNVVSVEDAAGQVSSNVYDALSRVIVAIDPLGHSVTNEYDAAGRLVATTDQQGRVTEYTYDALGRLLKQARSGLEHTFEYDAAGNRTAYINPKNQRIGFGFDQRNRVTAETNAIGEVTRYAYDPVGNRVGRTDARSRQTHYGYDPLNRLTSKLYPDSATVAYRYDASGNLTNIVDALGATHQRFDSMNRLVSVTDPFGQTVSNAYSVIGQREALVYPDGEIQTFAYDPAQRLTNTTATAFGVGAVSYAFDNVDNLTGIARPGGVTSSFTHDPLHRIVAYSAQHGASNFIQRALTRNALGFKTQEQIDAGLEVLTASSSQTYIHNQADQILDVYHNAPGMTVVPWYDPNGNITQVVHTVQIEAGPPLVFTSSYTYDFDNRLIAVESPLLVATYSYDGLGNLLQIVETGTVRRFVRDRADPLTRPLIQTDESGNPVQAYLWANGSLVAQVEANGAIHYAHFNELGHLLALTDENGAVTDQFAYHPYGRLVARTGSTDTPFAYMGAHGVMRAGYDLYLTRHRAYSANLMRFMQTDPLGLDGGLNLYAYAGGNPVFFVDALGLARMSPELAFAPRSDNLMSEAEYRGFQSQQQQAQTFLRALGANASSPQLAQQVSMDLLMTLPGAAVGGLVDDAVRGIIGAVRGGSVAAGTAAQTARSLQGSGLYTGIDRFRDITLQKGTIIYGGAPGQTAFYTTESALVRASGSRTALAQGLQIAPHPSLGYRPGVTAYEVIQETPAAFGRALANPQFGSGRLPQVVVPDFDNALSPLYTIPFRQ